MKLKKLYEGKKTNLFCIISLYTIIISQFCLVQLATLKYAFAQTSSPASDSFSIFPKPQIEDNPIQELSDAYTTVSEDPSIKFLLSIDNGAHALSITQRVTDEDSQIKTTKFQHYFRGIEVVGSMSFHHKGKKEVEIRNIIHKFELNTEPSLNAETAMNLARGIVGDRSARQRPELKILPRPGANSAKLVYWIDLMENASDGGHDIIIDAHTGLVLADISHILTINPIRHTRVSQIDIHSAKDQAVEIDPSTVTKEEIEQLRNKCQVLDQKSGAPLLVNHTSCNKVFSRNRYIREADSSTRQATSNSKRVIDYFRTKHNRNSYDGNGSTLVSIVHIGRKFSNAFWSTDKNIMAYGDGDGEIFGDFTNAMDVAGHEMTHGVTSQTAKLLYMSESGALNEAYSDFFGKMIADDNNWIVGRNVFLKQTPRKGIRDLANPGSIRTKIPDSDGNLISTPYPAAMREKLPEDDMCNRSNDNCWVHVNSTIPSHASYLVHEAIGRPRTEKLYYVVLTQYLNANADFKTAASATMSACKNLFDSDTCTKVSKAFYEVGL